MQDLPNLPNLPNLPDLPLLAADVGNKKEELKETESQSQLLVEGKKGSISILNDNKQNGDKRINFKEEEIRQKRNEFRDKICLPMRHTTKKLTLRKVRWIIVTTVCLLLWLLFLAALSYWTTVLEQNGGFIPWVLNTTPEFHPIFEKEDDEIKEKKTLEGFEQKREEREREQEIKNRSDIFRFFVRAQSEDFPELPWRVKILWTFQPAKLVSCILDSYFEKFTLIDALLRYITEQDCLPSGKSEKKASCVRPILGTLDERRHSKLICHREKLIDKLFECYEPTYKRISLLSDVETTLEERRFVKSLVKFLSTQLIRYPISISLLLRQRDSNSLFKLCLKEREEWVNYVVGQKVMELNFLPNVLAKHVCAYL